MRELKILVQLPFVIVATKFIWSFLSKKDKDDRMSDMWVAIILTESPVLSSCMRSLYDWCVENY